MKFFFIVSFIILLSKDGYANALFPRQWALKNSGQIIYDIDSELTRNPKVGVKGVDINWANTSDLLTKDSLDEVVVAVIDSGIDLYHPDLKDKIWFNEKVCKDLSDDERIIKPCYGWNFLNKNSNLKDDVGHGTHVAGIIAASDNDLGIKGAASERVKIMPLKVIDARTNQFVVDNQMITDIIADAIRFALENGAHIINMSLGWPGLVETPKIKIAIKRAYEMNVPVVVASGNNGKEVPTFPCSYATVICVGSHDNRGEISDFSNKGGKVDIYAPGEDIVSLIPTDMESRVLRIHGYETKKGSSQAAPFVTSTLANLRMLNPLMSIDEIYGRLLHSSYQNKNRLNMTACLQDNITHFVRPIFKEVLEVHFDGNTKKFNFSIPIKNYLNDLHDVDIDIRITGDAFKLKESKFKLNALKANETLVLDVEGYITDLYGDSQTELIVSLKSLKNEFMDMNFKNMLVFSKLLKIGGDFESLDIKNIDHRLLSYFSKDRKSTRMRPVINSSNANATPEYFYFDPRKDTASKTVVSILRSQNEIIQNFDIELPKMNKVLYVIKKDFNFDGREDYLIYSMAPDKTKLIFSFYDYSFQELFSINHWEMEISTFEGLPIDGQVEKFSWIKKNTQQFGDVLVPVILKNWKIPEEDNTKNPLERLRDYNDRKLYYLNIQVEDDSSKVKLSPRLFANYKFLNDIVNDLGLFYDENINLESPFVQTEEDLNNGHLNILVSVGREFDKKYFYLKFEHTDRYTITQMPKLRRFLENNSIFSIKNLKDGKKNESSIFISLISRFESRLTKLSPHKNNEVSMIIKTDGYNDPIFNYTAGFYDEKKDEYTFFIESRYHVWSYTKKSNGEIWQNKLEINRESSFPGQSFSETLWPLTIEINGQKRPGLFINSTLIFGERLYAMVKNDDGSFIRPLGLSVVMPENCISLYSGNNPLLQSDNDEMGFILLCRDKNLNMSLGFMSAKL